MFFFLYSDTGPASTLFAEIKGLFLLIWKKTLKKRAGQMCYLNHQCGRVNTEGLRAEDLVNDLVGGEERNMLMPSNVQQMAPCRRKTSLGFQGSSFINTRLMWTVRWSLFSLSQCVCVWRMHVCLSISCFIHLSAPTSVFQVKLNTLVIEQRAVKAFSQNI